MLIKCRQSYSMHMSDILIYAERRSRWGDDNGKHRVNNMLRAFIYAHAPFIRLHKVSEKLESHYARICSFRSYFYTFYHYFIYSDFRYRNHINLFTYTYSTIDYRFSLFRYHNSHWLYTTLHVYANMVAVRCAIYQEDTPYFRHG